MAGANTKLKKAKNSRSTEDITKLIVECNGPLSGTEGTEGRVKALHVLSE